MHVLATSGSRYDWGHRYVADALPAFPTRETHAQATQEEVAGSLAAHAESLRRVQALRRRWSFPRRTYTPTVSATQAS